MAKTLLSLFAVVLLGLVAFAPTADAYMAGHHNDLIRSLLRQFGYTDAAADLAVIGNWYVDYFDYIAIGSRLFEMDYMHSGSLYNASELWENTITFARNARAMIDASGTSAEAMLVSLGLVLHQTADLMAHSNFGQRAGVYRSSCSCFSDVTPTTALTTGADLSALRSGGYNGNLLHRMVDLPDDLMHGDICKGMNKDSYARPLFEESYVAAFLWMAEWMNALHAWRPQLATVGRTYAPTSDIKEKAAAELESMYYVAMYGANPFGTEDGEWKGPYSGSTMDFASKLASNRLMSNPFRDFVTTNIGVITNGMYQFTEHSPSTTTLDPYPMSMRLLTIRIPHFKIASAAWFGGDDPYAVVYIDGQKFVESAMMDESELDTYWKTMQFVPTTKQSVSVSVELWNCNDPRSDSQYDISPSSALGIAFTVDMATGELHGDATGIHSDPSTKLSFSGNSGDKATIQMYVSVRQIGNCHGVGPITCSEDLPVLPSGC